MRSRREIPPLQEIDLIPMLTVMLGVLAFFVVVTTTLSNQSSIETPLPSNPNQSSPNLGEPIEPFVIEMLPDGQLLLNDQVTSLPQLEQQIPLYLQQAGEDGRVVFKPDFQVPYEEVIQRLGRLQSIGGDRIVLTIDP